MTVPDRLIAALADRYRIERELGAGGMATVFLAYDLRHNRKVALKVMRPELAAVIGAERFLAEITTTANLQHPHILALFDSGTVEGTVFYVMPLVEGESLRDRLDREKQLPIDDAVRIATEVAGALQYAHDHGVIHRDIKPENILLHGGHAQVADFGIALAAVRTGGSRMTETGMSLGTPTYMSPEQAMGERALDARTDIYALGCVLYEMLVGDPPHTGSTAQAIVAKVITEKPPSVVAQRDRVPPHVEDAVLTALEKLPADRFASAADFALALSGRGASSPRITRPGAVAARTRSVSASILLGVVAVVAATAGWLGREVSTRPVAPAPIQFTTSLARPGIDGPRIAISEDGRRIVQSVSDSAGIPRLMVRDLGSNTVTTIPGTEQSDGAGFSPDGGWLAFVANGKLRKIAVKGGPATTLVDAMTVDGSAAWTPTGDIIFSGRNTGLWRVSADGGAPVQLTRVDTARKEFGHWSPQVLPGGRGMIYTSYAVRSRVEAYDFKSGKTTVLVDDAVFGRYSPTGHLLYARDAAVFAIPFDPKSLKTRGAAVPVQDDVVWEPTNALAGFAISSSGTFVYLRDSEWSGDRTLVWRDREGRDFPAVETPGAFAEPRISPDGRWIALTVTRPKLEVWLYDVGRRVLTQLTRAPQSAFNAAWLPDSRRIVYTFEDPVYNLHVIPIDGSAPDRALSTTPYDKYASSISPDGRLMLATETTGGQRLILAPLTDSTPPRPVMEAGPGLEQRRAVFSPDGRWIAFEENEGTRADIYIRSVSGERARRLVSAGGGGQPRWTRGGREIVYMTGAAMMSVAVNPSTGEVGAPVALFSVTDLDRRETTHSYDVSADGQRFLVAKHVERRAAQPMVVILNWRPDLGQRAGGTR